MVIEGAARNACFLGEFADADVMIALGREQLPRRLDESPARFIRVA
jgi:hypothetical protein